MKGKERKGKERKGKERKGKIFIEFKLTDGLIKTSYRIAR